MQHHTHCSNCKEFLSTNIVKFKIKHENTFVTCSKCSPIVSKSILVPCDEYWTFIVKNRYSYNNYCFSSFEEVQDFIDDSENNYERLIHCNLLDQKSKNIVSYDGFEFSIKKKRMKEVKDRLLNSITGDRDYGSMDRQDIKRIVSLFKEGEKVEFKVVFRSFLYFKPIKYLIIDNENGDCSNEYKLWSKIQQYALLNGLKNNPFLITSENYKLDYHACDIEEFCFPESSKFVGEWMIHFDQLKECLEWKYSKEYIDVKISQIQTNIEKCRLEIKNHENQIRKWKNKKC